MVSSSRTKTENKEFRQLLSGKPSREDSKATVYVPKELDMIINGLEVESVSNIQYGKNIRVRLGLRKAEVNLFFGKRGFTVVECPRTGTNTELNQLCGELVRTHLNRLTLWPGRTNRHLRSWKGRSAFPPQPSAKKKLRKGPSGRIWNRWTKGSKRFLGLSTPLHAKQAICYFSLCTT